MNEKKYKLAPNEIKQLVAPMGRCVASDMITVDGLPVMYMERYTPDDETDSGWWFYSGKETREYFGDPDNLADHDINTIANYDPSIIPFLDFPPGVELKRDLVTRSFILVAE